jgi:arylsulfatase A-like enzyme
MPTPIGPDDFLIVAERSKDRPSGFAGKDAGIRNVVVFVMESVAAQYVGTYGGRYPVTPTIVARAKQSIQFDNIYAHAPNSHKAIVSLLTSTYPLISYKTLTREMPDADLAAISSELKQFGYRTAIFYSADLRYAGVDKFLEHHSFDRIHDFRSIDCDTKTDTSGGEGFLRHSADDRCTARLAKDWIQSGGAEPFFALIWTNMTHIPYYSSAPDDTYSVDDPDFSRYLGALRDGDEALRIVLDALQDQGLFESTLIVVTGDHGQAFGQHGQRGHGANLYEENIHIPLILINPVLGTGERRDVVGGQIDIAPTVFDILGLAPPPLWQGVSLFDDDRGRRTFFFSTWTDVQFGYRQGERKYIFNATENACEALDLSADPTEGQIRRLESGSECRDIRQRLAAWIQYQSGLADKLSMAANQGVCASSSRACSQNTDE